MGSKIQKAIILTLSLIAIGYMIYLHIAKSNEMDKYGLYNIGRIVEYKFHIEGIYGGRYEYYYKGVKYISHSFLGEEGFVGLSNKDKVYVGKYFLIKISSKNPEKSEIYLDKEVTNKELIKEAGFPLLLLE